MEPKLSSFGLERLYSRVDINCDKWLISFENLKSPPSLADGLDENTEKELRYLGCELIQSAAILLDLPQVAAATGQILYQRYFYQKSFVKFNFKYTAIACVLLASKIEEAPRRPRDIINVFHRLEHFYRYRDRRDKKWQPLMLDRNYINLKNEVIKAERRVLGTLGFVVHVKHPHKLIHAYVHALRGTDNVELMQRAWSYMNDGLRTDIFLRYPPETIACACIFLAARTVKDPVPLPNEPFDWFELFDSSDRDVKDIALILTKLYMRKKIPNWMRLTDCVEKMREKITGTKVSKFQPVTEAMNDDDKDRSDVKSGADESGKHVNGKIDSKQKRRDRSRSGDLARRKSIPKRYRSPSNERDRRKEKSRYRDGKRREQFYRSPIRRDVDRRQKYSGDGKDRNRSKMSRRTREKEVIEALEKRRKESSSPEIVSKKH